RERAHSLEFFLLASGEIHERHFVLRRCRWRSTIRCSTATSAAATAAPCATTGRCCRIDGKRGPLGVATDDERGCRARRAAAPSAAAARRFTDREFHFLPVGAGRANDDGRVTFVRADDVREPLSVG